MMVLSLFQPNCNKHIAVRGDFQELQEKPKAFFAKDHHYLYLDDSPVLHHKTGDLLFPEPIRGQPHPRPQLLGDVCQYGYPVIGNCPLAL